MFISNNNVDQDLQHLRVLILVMEVNKDPIHSQNYVQGLSLRTCNN